MMKRILAFFTSALILTAGGINAAAAGQGKGDVNSDGRINVTDIAVTAAHIKGIKAMSSSQQKLADADGSGRIDVSDIAVIAAHIKGLKSIGSGSGSSSNSDDRGSQLFDLTNRERTSAGLSAYKYSSSLTKAAQIRAKEIANTFSHTRPNGSRCFTVLDELGINYYSASENIAGGQSSASEAVSDFMGSQHHHDAIMSTQYTHMGTACYYDSGSRTYYWVQLFGTGDL
ncbi:MAG: serine protease [Ruminococcus sp.]|nr:serine protease [Ruminococcus sp.]